MAGSTAKRAAVQLPEYLGLGILDPDSVELGLDEIAANYQVADDLLYRVTVRDHDVRIVEYFDGEPIATTTQPRSLQDAFFRHLATQLPYQSRRFEQLFHQLQDRRNVVVRFAEAPHFFYFPAGYLFTLRQPVGGGNQARFDALTGQGPRAADPALPELQAVREGLLLKLLTTGEVTAEPVRVADFSAELHRVAEAVDGLLQGGFVPREAEYQLVVLDSSLDKANSLVIYLGDQKRGIVTFAVVITEGTDLELSEVQNDFGAASIQWLESLKKPQAP